MNEQDTLVAQTLVATALERGYHLALWDAEDGDYLVQPTRNPALIMRDINAMDYNVLEVWDISEKPEELYLGHFLLIANNGSEDDPMVYLADHSANELMTSLYDTVQRKVEASS